MPSELKNSDDEPEVLESTPLKFRLALIWRQIELFSRYLKFHWRVGTGAPIAPQGFKFHGNRHVINGTFEPNETRVFSHLIERVDGLVNVGANVGYYCCIALQVGKPVIAFEPVDLNVRHLLANVRLNGWEDRFELLPICLGNQVGVVPLYGGGTGASLLRGWANSLDSHVNLAPINTANNLLATRLSGSRQLFMVDIEGAEAFFLEGASKLISTEPKNIWIIEISISSHRNDGINPKLKSVFSHFWNEGYTAWTIGDSCKPVKEATIDEVIREQRNTFDVGNNFLFMPKGEFFSKSVKAD